jgi:hypothetical protein
VGAGALTVNLYGTSPGRRVEVETAPLAETGPVPVEEVEDATLLRGERVVDAAGAPPRETSVRRRVYDRDGSLLYDSTWSSRYTAEPSLVRVGTKPPPKPKPKPASKPAAGAPDAGAPADGATTALPPGESATAAVLP